MTNHEACTIAHARFCPIHEDLSHECPRCPISKHCWAGYHIDANRMTNAEFTAWMEQHNADFSAAVAAYSERS